jgi:hypothetical protein
LFFELEVRDSIDEFRTIYEWISVVLKVLDAVISCQFLCIDRIFFVPLSKSFFFVSVDSHIVSDREVENASGGISALFRSDFEHTTISLAAALFPFRVVYPTERIVTSDAVRS